MRTIEFFNLLKQYSSHDLRFEYQPGKYVDHGFHITEVKHVNIDAVNCGSGTESWNETLVQLWESPEEKEKDNLNAFKALGILNKVGRLKPYDLEAQIKFEYGNDQFHISQLFVNNYLISGRELIIILGLDRTDCKAKETCRVKPEVATADQNNPCCEPDGNCC
ncbi:MAG: hypothetical protein KJO25_05065 [Bacteroidia bacterium]|nr:hypothetical protein [Bacteroidia bacterium]